MPLFKVNILTGPPGSGKSFGLLTQAAKSPARYLLAVPLINLIEEHATTLKRLNPGLVVIPAHSQAKAKGTVAAHLTRIAAEITSKHVVVAITHESLLGLDLQAFADWRLLIDETPNAVVSGVSRWAAVGHLLPTACGLSPVGQRGWSRLTLKPESLTSRASDCSITKIDPALGRALRRPQGVLVKATTWKAIERLSEFSWLSVWSLNAARPCESVTLASASFSASLMARTLASAAPDDLHLTITTLAPQRAAQPTIRLSYFAQGHEGSTAFWDSSEGRRCLKAVADHLEHRVPFPGLLVRERWRLGAAGAPRPWSTPRREDNRNQRAPRSDILRDDLLRKGDAAGSCAARPHPPQLRRDPRGSRGRGHLSVRLPRRHPRSRIRRRLRCPPL